MANAARRLPTFLLLYGLGVALLGAGALVVLFLRAPEACPLAVLVLFVLFSVAVKRLGFQVAKNVVHSLVGVVDLAALFILGVCGGSVVAAVSGVLCQVLCAEGEARRRWPSLAFFAAFSGGLNALMAIGAGGVYRALGGVVPLADVTWRIIPAVVAACLVWFSVDHLGWALAEFLSSGREGMMRFLREILLYSLLIELLPLPLSVLISFVYLSSSAPLLLLMVFSVLGLGLVLRRLVISLHAERRRVQQLVAIAEVSRKVAAILDLKTLFADTVKLVQSTFGYYHVGIFTVDGETQRVIFQASSNPLIQARGELLRWGEGIVGQVVLTGESMLVNDVRQDRHFVPDGDLAETRAELAVPLKVEQRILGVLDVQSDQRDAFGEQDLFVACTLADQIAIAIEDSRLYQTRQEQAWVSTALLQVAEAMAQLSAPEEILETGARLALMLTGVDRCMIFLWSEDEQVFSVGYSAGLARVQAEALQGQRFGAEAIPLLDRVRRSGEIIHGRTPDLVAFLPPPLAADARLGQLVALPLRVKGEVSGVLAAEDLDGDARLAPYHQTILTGLANDVAMALENARLLAAQREEAWVTTALLQVANTISASSDLGETLSTVVRLTSLLVGVTWCALWVWDEQRGVFVGARAYGLPRAAGAAFEGSVLNPQEAHVLQRMMAGPGLISVPREEIAEPIPATLAGALSGGTLTALPLRARDKLRGALLAGQTGPARALSLRQVNILSGISNQVALAIESARLYQQTLQQERLEREIELAHGIQTSFLPEHSPQLPGWQIAVEWQPARGVSGDYYDFITLDAEHLGLVIADISDKGVAAALYMALTRTVIRAATLGTHSPAAALRQANRILLEDARSGMFVSMFYGVLDLARGLLTYARAGHNPPLWVRAADRSVSLLAPPGAVLGILDDPQIVEERVQLAVGDTLVCYTDGVTEAVDEREQEFGEERLRSIVGNAPDHSAESLVELIKAAVRVFTGERAQFDDLTLVVLKRSG